MAVKYWQYWLTSVVIALVGVCWYSDSYRDIISWLLVMIFGSLGFVLGASMALTSGKKYIPKQSPYHPRISNLLFTKMMVSKFTLTSMIVFV